MIEVDHLDGSLKLSYTVLYDFYTTGIYSEGYIVFIFPFICLFVRPFVHPSVRPSVTFVEFTTKLLIRKHLYLDHVNLGGSASMP